MSHDSFVLKRLGIEAVPQDWQIEPLSEVVAKGKPIVYGIVQAGPHVEGGIPYIKSTDVNRPLVLDDLQRTSVEIAGKYKRSEVGPGDIIFSLRGNIGESCIVPDSITMANLTQGTARLAVNGSHVNSFVRYALSGTPVQRQIYAYGKGSTFKEISLAELRKLFLLLPPLPEQQKIAAILSTWDRAIELTEKLILAKQKRKQALMQQLLTGKVRFAEFEGKPWKQVRLGELLKEVKRMVEWDDNAEYHLLSIRRRSGGMFDRETKLGHDIKTKVMMTTETGDFVIARMQAVHGAITVTPPECHGKHVSGSYSTFIAKDPDKLHMPFLNYVSQTLSFYRLLLLSAYGVTIEKMTFNLPWFLNEKIEMPPTLAEQKRIADVFDSFERENAALGRRLESLKHQKKGLMQQLLTGKVRVNVAQETAKG